LTESLDLEPDDLPARLALGEQPPDVVPLVGFLGPKVGTAHRMYANERFDAWLDIEEQDIVHRHRIPAERDAFGGRTVLFVKGDAMKRPLREDTADRLAGEFLSGPFSSEPLLPKTLGDAANQLTFLDTWVYTSACCSGHRLVSFRLCP
jgi:hypothetical protein